MIAGAAPPSPRPKTAARLLAPQVLLNGVDPITWNTTADRERGSAAATPTWPAVRILGPFGTESLYVFPPRARAPTLLASWPRQEAAAHRVRIFPGYRWIVIETPVDSTSPYAGESATGSPSRRRARFYDASGALAWEMKTARVPAALGRDLVLAERPSAADSTPPRLSVLRVPGGSARASWPGLWGWGASSPLENFLAVNTIGVFDPTTGTKQDEIRLIDLEGKILWARGIAADPREFAVSNFGDVAIAREGQLFVLDRYGAEKLRVTLPRNSVGRTAITADGRHALVAMSSPLPKHAGGGLWVGLYETTRAAPVWTRRNVAEGAKLAEALEVSLSEDGQRALLRLSTGEVLLLGRDGRQIASWKLDRVPRGEYDPGSVPRRTWLSGDGTWVAFTTPVARSLPEARGWLFRVPR